MARFVSICSFVAVTCFVSFSRTAEANRETCQEAHSKSGQAADSAFARDGAEGFAKEVVEHVSLAQLDQPASCADVGDPISGDTLMGEAFATIRRSTDAATYLHTFTYPSSMSDPDLLSQGHYIPYLGTFTSSLEAIAARTKIDSEAVRKLVCDGGGALAFAKALKESSDALTPVVTEYLPKIYQIGRTMQATDKKWKHPKTFETVAREPFSLLVNYGNFLDQLIKEQTDNKLKLKLANIKKGLHKNLEETIGKRKETWLVMHEAAKTIAKIYKLRDSAPLRYATMVRSATMEVMNKPAIDACLSLCTRQMNILMNKMNSLKKRKNWFGKATQPISHEGAKTEASCLEILFETIDVMELEGNLISGKKKFHFDEETRNKFKDEFGRGKACALYGDYEVADLEGQFHLAGRKHEMVQAWKKCTLSS